MEQESKEDKPSLAQRNLVCSNQMKNSQSVQQTQNSSNGISPVFKTPKTAFPQVLRFLGFEFALDRLFYIRFGQTKLRWTKEDKNFLFHPREKIAIYFLKVFTFDHAQNIMLYFVALSGCIKFILNLLLSDLGWTFD